MEVIQLLISRDIDSKLGRPMTEIFKLPIGNDSQDIRTDETDYGVTVIENLNLVDLEGQRMPFPVSIQIEGTREFISVENGTYKVHITAPSHMNSVLR
jgi:hypothetical protein